MRMGTLNQTSPYIAMATVLAMGLQSDRVAFATPASWIGGPTAEDLSGRQPNYRGYTCRFGTIVMNEVTEAQDHYYVILPACVKEAGDPLPDPELIIPAKP
jgi:hypothetical protein